MTVYVAFPASDKLHRNTVALLEAVANNPGVIHQQLITEISEDFISEVLEAFFDGPVKSLNVQGSMASVMNGVISIIGKASRALVHKVFHKVSTDEQRALADQFSGIQVIYEGKPWCGFPLDPEVANEAALMFESFRKGSGEEAHLIHIMGLFADGAIEHFFDRTMGLVKTGAITRGLVGAGRATIHKAAHSAMQKSLPGLHPKVRQPVLNYFESMLIEV
ncbi:hypothetical protein [Alcanivorax sp. 1008]|uniref:hypothetical protein n=1 Tax=Alcanivorax sp. 1008 TaxID=2816853 RepID=UPI001D4016AF|nr:hypothetical protein [Alcanivorax sp. 1008]MCC1496373.1 hypothetical protein [Alcanivorax sp. 1008]